MYSWGWYSLNNETDNHIMLFNNVEDRIILFDKGLNRWFSLLDSWADDCVKQQTIWGLRLSPSDVPNDKWDKAPQDLIIDCYPGCGLCDGPQVLE